MAELILASGSRFRRQMLEQAGVRVMVQPADVDETALKAGYLRDDPGIAPGDIALRLAEAKARAVAVQFPGAMVIGSDQVLAFDGDVLSKPVSVAAARGQLKRLRGRTHSLPTAVVLIRDGEVLFSQLVVPMLTMREFSDDFLEHYLREEGNSVCETVGGYKLEGLGGQLFDAIEGDYFSIIGLPLLPLLAALRQHGQLAV